MEDKFIEVFKSAKYKPEADLPRDIWKTIIDRDRRITRIKLWAFSIVGFISFAGLIPALKILLNDLTQSGFYEYFSLAFSDGGMMLAHWREFTFTLAESLPTISIIFTLSLLFVCFLSLRYLVKQFVKTRPIGPVGLLI